MSPFAPPSVFYFCSVCLFPLLCLSLSSAPPVRLFPFCHFLIGIFFFPVCLFLSPYVSFFYLVLFLSLSRYICPPTSKSLYPLFFLCISDRKLFIYNVFLLPKRTPPHPCAGISDRKLRRPPLPPEPLPSY
jgi:hypothetical protein